MKKAVPVLAAILLIIVGTGATDQLLPESHSAEEAPALDLASQIDEDVHTALMRNSQATSLYDWHKSGFTPTDVFANVHALKRPDAFAALCGSLGRLAPSDLALFENEIRFAGPKTRLPCAIALTESLDRYWRSVREELARTRSQPFTGHKGLAVGLPTLTRRTSPRQAAFLANPVLRPGEVSLTFDEGPHPIVTREILGALAEFDVRANFFEVGMNASAHPEVSRLITKAGHTLGSLTWKHPSLAALTIKEAEIEIRRGRELVATAGGSDSGFFRFPYGDHSGPLDDFVKAQKMAALSWNIDSQDWKLRNPRALVAHILAELDRNHEGVIRFHDVYQQTAIALPYLLEELRARNYTAVVFTGR